MRSYLRKRRAARWGACTVALALALVCVKPRPAKAELTLATVTAIVGLVGATGEALGKWEWLFGGSGPNLASQLNAVKVAIINELRSQRNQLWRANVQTVFDNYAILGNRPRNDPNNEPLRFASLETSKQAFNHYAIIVEDGNDPTSAYELAPMFSVLTGVHAGLTKMKGELNSSFPAKWMEYDIYLKRSVQASNRLVGTTSSGCWPGYNPGRGKYILSSTAGYLTAGSAPANFKKSLLWKKLGNKNIKVADITVRDIWKMGCVGTGVVRPGTCNLATRTCKVTLTSGETMNPSYACYSPRPFPNSSSLPTAENILQPTFDADGAVKVVRATIVKMILAMGGGDDRWSNETVPTSGALTDPWLDEPACGPFGPWSYPATVHVLVPFPGPL
jgi:hypothetical protein